MTRRGRTTLVAAIAVAAVALSSVAAAAETSAGALGTPHGIVAVPKGFAVVQYASTSQGPLPWNAHLLSAANPSLATAGGPHAVTDGHGVTMLAYRNPSGHIEWLRGAGASVAKFGAQDLTAATNLAPIASEPVPVIGASGADQVFYVSVSGHLIALTRGFVRRSDVVIWRPTDLTSYGGPRVAGTPSVVVSGTTTAVFTKTKSGDVIEYVNDASGGRTWSGYDLSVIAAGPKVASDVVGFYDPVAHELRVASTELGPHRGDVVVFSPDDVGGRIWSFQDVSMATHTPGVSAGLAATLFTGSPVLLGAGPTGDLTEYVGTDGTGPTTWKVTDLTQTVGSAPEISGTPSVTVQGGRMAVAAVAASWGDLFVWANSAAKGAFVATDVSITGTGPTRTVAGTPAALYSGGVLSMFAAGTSVPAPEGTGVYAIPWTKWGQALKDGWPVLGVTGGLGTQCAPWTGYPTPTSSTPPDEYVGQTIQSSHLRETWLSFWTVSGPRTAPGQGCTAEKGPVSAQSFYAHGYAAGSWVATQIDGYRAQGLGLKPDWVIFDPEGYPDNHSGLWGPTSTPTSLATSVADWYAILAGWHAGITSVDPSLKAALYANQYEYMTYRLFGQALPTFIAGSFTQKVVNKQKKLVAPSRTAFGSNIRGFVMYNSFTPTCTQVTNERLILTEAPWNGAYNTLQTSSIYCAPGP